ncbi:hypothetical protein J7E87_17485 [Streptomyces sp. ISL-1]|uniref:hypothetical protein n=1 Tax=Streptomyces sp. ISL-1 TaxID=2817657 RepID=UPI001BE79AD7|nr:hypothetical protein [Streptomyces sp. ISL-1]MBT2391174.1 hypothetical protein [Streptomyces sp. ISL-1]
MSHTIRALTAGDLSCLPHPGLAEDRQEHDATLWCEPVRDPRVVSVHRMNDLHVIELEPEVRIPVFVAVRLFE